MKGPVAAGSTSILDATGVDCSGYDRATFFVGWGAITAGGIYIRTGYQSDDDGVVDDYDQLAGAEVILADDDDNTITMLEIYRPLKRWLRAVVVRAVQDSTVELAWCVLSEPSASGAALSSTVSGYEEHASPVEGTA